MGSTAGSWYVRIHSGHSLQQKPATLDEALAQLKHDPKSPVQARVGELDVELRVIGEAQTLTWLS